MNAVLATVTVSVALSAVQFSPVFGQAARGGGAGSSLGGNAITPGTPARGGTAPSSAAIGTPGTGTPVGPVNPGGITAIPPQVTGRTFERSTIGGGPTDTIINPAAPQPTFRFPPSSTLTQPIITNFGVGQFESGFPPVSAGGNAPVTVGNTVGAGGAGAATNIRPVEPVAINLPPGARITTNAFGVPEIGFPPVTVPIATNAVGSSPGVQSSTVRVAPVTPVPVAPVRVPTTVPR